MSLSARTVRRLLAGLVACVAMPLVGLGCVAKEHVMQERKADHYEQAFQLLEREPVSKYCSELYSWVPAAPLAAPGTLDEARTRASRHCVDTLSALPDRPGKALARERVLKCMQDSGWKRERNSAGDTGREIETICLSDNSAPLEYNAAR